jgi:four helix bundle protein
MFRFERLVVWQKALELFDLADQIADLLPQRHQFSLADQLRRAALSVSSNIAEGSGRETERETRHFFTIAKSSTFEVVSILTVCLRRRLTGTEQYQTVYGLAEEISKMLTALKRNKRRVNI